MINELKDIYFKDDGSGEFIWRQPNDGNIKLGFPIIRKKETISDLLRLLDGIKVYRNGHIKGLLSVLKLNVWNEEINEAWFLFHHDKLIELNQWQLVHEHGIKIRMITDTIKYIEDNVKIHFKEFDEKNLQNLQDHACLDESQKATLHEFIQLIFDLGMHTRRWPGGDKPYPLRLDGPDLIYFSDDIVRERIKSEELGFLLKDAEASDVVSPEKLSILTDFMQENIFVESFEKVLNYNGTTLDLLRYIYNNNINVRRLLTELEVDPISIDRYLNDLTKEVPDLSILSNEKIFSQIKRRLEQNQAVHNLYTKLFRYDIIYSLKAEEDNTIKNTGYKLYSTLESMRTKLKGTNYAYTLGDCIQQNGHILIVSAASFFEDFEGYFVPNFDVKKFRYLHY